MHHRADMKWHHFKTYRYGETREAFVRRVKVMAEYHYIEHD